MSLMIEVTFQYLCNGKDCGNTNTYTYTKYEAEEYQYTVIPVGWIYIPDFGHLCKECAEPIREQLR